MQLSRTQQMLDTRMHPAFLRRRQGQAQLSKTTKQAVTRAKNGPAAPLWYTLSPSTDVPWSEEIRAIEDSSGAGVMSTLRDVRRSRETLRFCHSDVRRS